MKKNYFSLKTAFCVLFLAIGLGASVIKAQAPVTQTFNFTGSVQSFTVPSCVSSISVTASGAQGVGMNGFAAGNGGRVFGVLTVTPGQVLSIYVGGTNAFNGGGIGLGGANGGGATDIRIGGVTLANRVIVAGGGGGAGGDNWQCLTGTGHGGGGTAVGTNGFGGAGGAGYTSGTGCGTNGGAAGGTGGTGFHGGGGGGGGLTAGGGGALANSIPAGSGSLGLGGNSYNSPSCGATGGGGGGYYGGGGAAGTNCGAGRGGGGSSWSGTLTSPSFTAGVQTGNGQLSIIYGFNGNGVAVSATSQSICVGTSMTLTASGMNSYTWSTGSNAASISDTPTITTSYTVQGTNSVNCVSSAVITVTVDAAVPTLSVTNTASLGLGICPGNTVVLTASGATTYTWTGGVANGIAFSPALASGYTVTGGNACGTTTAATSVSVHPLPPVTASVSQPSVCSGNTVAFVGGGAVTYTWTSGVFNGQPYFPPATQNYSVTGTSALGCTATAVVGNTVVATPVLAPIATPTIICMGGSGTISATGATNYTWLPVPANNFVGSNNGTITITPTITATYTIIKANSNCVDTKTITLVVNPLPTVFALAQPSLVCAGSTATLSGGGANTYTWIPSSFNLIGANVVVTPTANTIYTVSGSDGTCVATYTLLLATKITPTITAVTTASSICAGGTVTLTATGAGPGGTYVWTPGGAGAVIVDSPTAPTAYLVVGTNSVNCPAQTSQIVVVNPNPVVNAVTNRTLVCVGGPSTITASGAHTYSWSTGALTQTTVVFTSVNTVYTVTGTYTTTGCIGTKTILIQAYTPVTAINGPTAVCIGSSITISSAPANSYTWSVNGSPLGNNNSIYVGPIVNTTYSLGTTSTSNNVSCVGANTVNIIVNPLPIVTAATTRSVICRNYEFTTLNAGGAVSYNWLFIGAGSSVTVAPTNQTTYTVEGTDANGCLNTATVIVRVSACLGVGEQNQNQQQITIFPNPSSGEFSLKAEKALELNLVNELGQVIRTIDLNAGNNYQTTIRDIAKGVYFIVGKNKQDLISQKVIVQ